MAAPEFRLPNDRERAVVFGATGTGKTVFATWLLSHASIEDRPWIIIDPKKDGYLIKLPRVEKIKLGELPRHSGVYIIQTSVNDDAELDAYFHKMLAKGNVGLFTDELSSVPNLEPRYRGLKAIFSQGRSKHVPVIAATQRPAWINKSVLSEGDYFAVFRLRHADDRDRASKFIPEGVERRLDDYHSLWYDAKRDAYFHLGPVDEAETFARFDERLKPRQRLI
jgi:DNA helicase HerA-like ATPase